MASASAIALIQDESDNPTSRDARPNSAFSSGETTKKSLSVFSLAMAYKLRNFCGTRKRNLSRPLGFFLLFHRQEFEIDLRRADARMPKVLLKIVD